MKGGGACGTHPTIYEHLSAEEHRLELERTREELRNVKKLLAERDTEILQLKTAHRKLQDALRKKVKDLQNVFSVLRAPQDAELTKKQKAELVERLLMETQQRVVNAESVAEERKRELDKLKFSSKFLRHQELDVEIEECHREIERLRSLLSQYTIVGKLKISRRSTSADGPKPSLSKPKRLVQESQGNPVLQYREQVVAPIAAPSAKPVDSSQSAKRESFVERTRRRAVEAEYQKQVRLAQLEAECELEENLRIFAKREAAAQAEMRRQKKIQEGQRGKRTECADVTPVADPPAEIKDEPLIVAEMAATPVESEISCPFQITASAATAQAGVIEVPADVLIAMEGLVADVIEQVEQSELHHDQPKQYDDDGFDDGAEDDNDPADASKTPAQRDDTKDGNVSADDDDMDIEEVEEDVDSTVESGLKPPVVVGEVFDDEDEDVQIESKEGPEKEAEAEIVSGPGSPVDDDSSQEGQDVEQEARQVETTQGFLLDPVNPVDVPCSPWSETTAAYTIENEQGAEKVTAPETEEVSGAAAGAESAEDEENGVGKDNYEEVKAHDDEETQGEDLPVEEGQEAEVKDARDQGAVVAAETSLSPETHEPIALEPSSLDKSAEDISTEPVAADETSKPCSNNGDHEEMEEPNLHACNDAASELINRPIDAAAASLAANEATPSSLTAAPPTTILSQGELALAMDAAARKLQEFWRDKVAKWSPTTQHVVEPLKEDPVSSADCTKEKAVELEHEAVADTEEGRAESPVVSETEHDGW